MDNEQYILFHRYSIIGKQYAEKITEEEHNRFPKDISIYDSEMEAIGDQNVKDLQYLVLCGTNSFIYPDKEKDNIFSKRKTIELLRKKVSKDYKIVQELQFQEELDGKQQKKLKTSQSGLRSGLAIKRILDNSPESLKVMITTRNATEKLSVANWKYNKSDIGSGVQTLLMEADEEIILDLLVKCNECGQNEFCFVTGGMYSEREETAEKIKKKIINYCEENKIEFNVKNLMYRLQPLRPSVEKCCLLSQRDILTNQAYETFCLQGGNRDGVVLVNGKFVCDIKVKDIDYEKVLVDIKNEFNFTFDINNINRERYFYR